MAKRKKSRRKVSALNIAYWVIVVALIVTIGFVIKNIISLHMEKNRLEKQEQELLNTKEELNAELKNVDDLEYIEEQARKLLKMIKPGEVLYVLEGDNPTSGQDNEQQTEEVIVPEPEPQEEPEETWEETEETETTEDWSEETTGEDTETTEEWTEEDTTWEDTGDNSEESWDDNTEDTGIVSEEEVTEYVEEDVEE